MWYIPLINFPSVLLRFKQTSMKSGRSFLIKDDLWLINLGSRNSCTYLTESRSFEIWMKILKSKLHTCIFAIDAMIHLQNLSGDTCHFLGNTFRSYLWQIVNPMLRTAVVNRLHNMSYMVNNARLNILIINSRMKYILLYRIDKKNIMWTERNIHYRIIIHV